MDTLGMFYGFYPQLETPFSFCKLHVGVGLHGYFFFLLFLTTKNCPSSSACSNVDSLKSPSGQSDVKKRWSYLQTLL